MEISLPDLPHFADDFVAALPRETGERAYVVGLQGELGAGKTTFAQAVARSLGVEEPVTSPTFVLVQAHPVERPPFSRLVHVDAYRLSPDAKDTLGWAEYARRPENLILVEWPERLPGGMPETDALLSFSVTGSETRDITEHHGS